MIWKKNLDPSTRIFRMNELATARLARFFWICCSKITFLMIFGRNFFSIFFCFELRTIYFWFLSHQPIFFDERARHSTVCSFFWIFAQKSRFLMIFGSKVFFSNFLCFPLRTNHSYWLAAYLSWENSAMSNDKFLI